MEKKTGKKLSKFMSKLGALVHKTKPDCSSSDYGRPAMPGLSPLSAANNQLTRRKQQQLSASVCRAQDDCSQLPASSDQASQVARIEEQPQDSYASEHYGSECSLSESVRAATAHMAQLRTILVNHISETHDAWSVAGRMSGPNLLAALHREQQQCSSSSLEHPSCFSVRPSSSNKLPPGSPSTDRRVEALLADQMQLLDLVQTLIADHRNSLLEQQRLQQQLAATQEALHSERLDKDRAAALAHVRSEEVSKAQADLAAFSEAVQQLRAKRAISVKQMQLPSALAAAAASGVNAEESILHDTTEQHAASCQSGGGQQERTPCGTSAIIGRLAPEDSWQDMPAIVGPAPVDSSQVPLSAGAAAAAPAVPNSNKAAGSKQDKSSKNRLSSSKAAVNGSGRISLRSAPAAGQQEPRQRRLLGDIASSSSQSKIAGGAVAAAAAANATAAHVSQQQTNSRGSQESLQSAADASVHVQVVQQQQQQAVPATAAPARSTAAKLAQKQATALELLLLQRLNPSSCPTDANAQLQMLMHNSIETETSSLSVAWAGAAGDAAAAAVGLTKQQLHQLLQRPWLPNDSQGGQAGALSPEQSTCMLHADSVAAGDASATARTSTAAAACEKAAAGIKRKQWQRPHNNTAQAAVHDRHADSDDTESYSSVEQESESDSDLRSGCNSTDSDTNTCSEDSNNAWNNEHDSDGSSTHRSESSNGSDGSSMAGLQQQTRANGSSTSATASSSRAAAGAAAAASAGRGCPHKHQQQHVVGNSSASHGQIGNVHSSNGSSWPGMKAFMSAASSHAGMLAPVQQGSKPCPSPYKRTQKQGSRSRTQPMQICTSLESAETLSLATTATAQPAAGCRSASQSSNPSTAAAVCPCCSADGTACSCFVTLSGRGRGGAGSSSNGRMPAKLSTEVLQPCSEEQQGSSSFRRKLPLGAAGDTASTQQVEPTTAAVRGVSRQRQRVLQLQQQQEQQQPSMHPVLRAPKQLSPQQSGATASPAAATHGCDSDGEMSVASAATGCTTLSNLAGIDLQTKSQVKPRPAIVPKLDLPLIPQQQQQQQQGCGKQGNPNRALRLAQESDMAPLMSQPGSSRSRGRNTPRQAPHNAAEATGPAANAAMQVERAGGSFSGMSAAGSALGMGAARAQSFTAGHQQQQGCAAATPPAGQTAPSSPAHSTRSKRSSAPGNGNQAVVAAAGGGGGNCLGGAMSAARVGSANGSSSGVAGHYWGSSAGSYPASEEPSRQPTPTGEFVVPIYIPAAAGLPVYVPPAATGSMAPAHAVDATGTSGDVAASMVDGSNAARVCSEPAAAGDAGEVASEGAGSTGTACATAAQQFYQPVPAAQQAAQMLTITTPRGVSLTPRGLTYSSAAAAAAGSYMTMRPAHMYKSVSTVYAMYSPLRGGLRALGHTKPGAGGLGTGGAAAGALGCEQIGQAGVAEELGLAALEPQQQQQQQLLGTIGMLDVREPSTGNTSEHHWHVLLGTVPEEEGVVYGEALQEQLTANAAAAAAAGCNNTLTPSAAEAAAEAAAAAAAAAGVPAISDGLLIGRQGSWGNAAVLTSPSPISGGSDSELYYYVPSAAALPTRQDFQLMLQQEQQQQRLAQQERQQQQQCMGQLEQQEQEGKDVVDKGPVLRPGSASPSRTAQTAAVRRSSANSSSTRQPHASRQQQRASLTIQTPAADELDGSTVGPLTASSPTRRRNSANGSGSGTSSATLATGRAAATALQGQQSCGRHQQRSSRRCREHHVGHSRDRSSQGDGVTAAAIARVEAAAAAVAARVAAVAARQDNHQQQQSLEPEQLSSPKVVGAGVDAATAAVGSNSNLQSEEQQQQEGRPSRSQRSSTTRSCSASREQQQLQAGSQRHRQLQQAAGTTASGDPRSRRSRHRRAGSCSSSSSRHTQVTSMSNSTCTGNQLDSHRGSTEMVTSYHNPLVTLEDVGLGADDDAALVYAGLAPAFAPVAARSGSPGAGVAAAAVNQVPAHVTPLAKERSRDGGGGSKDGSMSQEQSGAGGQLHWNPLYDPEAMSASLSLGYAH